MSNLTPELRPDYTGKLVTRHVRADSRDSTLKFFPAPKSNVATKESKELAAVSLKLRELLEGYLADSVVLDDDDPDNHGWDEEIQDEQEEDPGFDASRLLPPEVIHETLKKLPPRTVAYMKAKMDAGPFNLDYQIALLHALTDSPDDHQFIEYLTHLQGKAFDLYPDADAHADYDTNSYTLIRKYVDSQRQYERLGHSLPENIFEATNEQRSVMEAVHVMNLDMSDEDGNVPDELVKVVLDHPSKVDRIFEVIDDRGVKDPKVIREVLESENQAVADGIL